MNSPDGNEGAPVDMLVVSREPVAERSTAVRNKTMGKRMQ